MRGKFFCKNKSKKMQNCEKTDTKLQVMTKGNQIKNFSKKRLKTNQTRLQHTHAVKKMYPKTKTKLRRLKTKQTLTVPRPGATIRIKLAPFKDWRMMYISN